MSRLALAALAVCSLVSSSALAADDHASVSRAGHAAEFRVLPDSYSGASFDLARSGAELRGRARGKAVSATLSGDTARGVYGGGPLDVVLTRGPNATIIRGNLGSGPIELTESVDRLSGRAGRCSYDLARTDGEFRGTSSCGGAPSTATVHLPAALQAKDPVERAVVIALLLG